jgi:DNA-binding transcriptional ArsR family regulator
MDVFAAISEPNRRRLLNGLLDGPQPVSALVDAVGMSQPVVSKHLRVLRDAGLVSVEPDGQRRLYSINAEPLADLDAWLKPYRRFWSAKLAALERHLGSNAQREK